MEPKHSRSGIYALQYHLVFCTKWRAKCINSSIKQQLINIVTQISKELDFEIDEINTDIDHVHILFNCSPTHSLPTIIKTIKGRSSYLLRKNNPEWRDRWFLSKQVLWSPSYFIAAVSENTESQIRQYIQNQGKKGGH